MSKRRTSEVVVKLYTHQEKSIDELLAGKHFIILGTGLGKGAISMIWADTRCRETKKNKVLVVTTASKAHMKPTDYEQDLKTWRPSSSLLKSLSSSLSVISWAKLSDWVNKNWKEIEKYVVVFDEIAAVKAGVSSQRGRAFLKLAKRNQDWAGFTATPGENWLHFYPYMQACGLVRNKTSFLSEYANVQTFKGYPEIVGWRHQDRLRHMWAEISYAPDAQKALSELPSETHKVIEFSKPKDYVKVLKTREKDGEFLDTTMKLCHTLRQICFTKDKEQWVRDFLENLGERVIIFYSYIADGDRLEEIAKKAVPSARVWRIDGSHHDIPTAETIGDRDIVLCQWQSGSEGLNFQFIDRWVSVTPNYSYSISIQARGRIQRIGAKHPKFFYYLKCKGCIEEDIYKALAKKSDFAAEEWCANNNLLKEK